MSGTNPLPVGTWANIANLGAGSMAPGGAVNGSPGQGAANARPLRGPPAAFVRQPYLGQAPAVASVTGFGTGSGAGLRNNGSDADQSQGLVAIKVGLAPAGTGTVVLVFPAAPPALFYAADWASLTSSGTTTQTITWTANRPLVTGETLLLAYQWLVSN